MVYTVSLISTSYQSLNKMLIFFQARIYYFRGNIIQSKWIFLSIIYEQSIQLWNFETKISIFKVKLATIVEGDLKAPFSIATTCRSRGGRYSFPWIAPLYPWSLPYNAECLARRHQVPFFESLVWLDLGLNPGLSDHWWTKAISLETHTIKQ